MSLDKQLNTLAERVVKDSDSLTDIWDQLNYYAKNKTLRDDKSIHKFNVDELEVWEIVTRLLTLPSFISKSKRKLATLPKGPKADELKRLIELKTIELEAIKELRHKK